MNAENIAKRKKKAKTQWHSEYHELKCLPKTCVSHPMSSIWTPRTDKTWVQFPTRRDVLALLRVPCLVAVWAAHDLRHHLPNVVPVVAKPLQLANPTPQIPIHQWQSQHLSEAWAAWVTILKIWPLHLRACLENSSKACLNSSDFPKAS